jgi:hypothetical protein
MCLVAAQFHKDTVSPHRNNNNNLEPSTDLYESSGSHGGEYKEDCLLGCCAVQFGPDDGGRKHL